MNATRHPVVAIVTHGAALLFGVSLVVVSARHGGLPEAQDERAIHNPGGGDVSAEWIDGKLQELREKMAAVELEQGLPLDELLKKQRAEAEAWKKRLGEEVDRIVAAARSHKLEADPAAAIRSALRGDGDALVILQAWLDRDPAAALAELGRNWALVGADEMPEILKREFGSKWILGQIGNSETPYRLRATLTWGLGRQLAWEGGLDALRQHHISIPDPLLKTRLVTEFTSAWPLEDPVKTAGFLAGDMPAELRKQLWLELANPSIALTDGLGVTWFEKLCDALGPDRVPDGYKRSSPSEFEQMELRPAESEAKSLDEIIQARAKGGTTRDAAVKEAVSAEVGRAMGDGTDLEELYGEGRISRQELLDELGRRIPGSETHREAVEREAWARTAGFSDPPQTLAWAADLSQRRDMTDLMLNAFAPGGIYEDPRIAQRLARYQIITEGMGKGYLRSRSQQTEVYEWGRWKSIAPVAAETWRKALPPGDPLHESFHEAEELERRRKEDPLFSAYRGGRSSLMASPCC